MLGSICIFLKLEEKGFTSTGDFNPSILFGCLFFPLYLNANKFIGYFPIEVELLIDSVESIFLGDRVYNFTSKVGYLSAILLMSYLMSLGRVLLFFW